MSVHFITPVCLVLREAKERLVPSSSGEIWVSDLTSRLSRPLTTVRRVMGVFSFPEIQKERLLFYFVCCVVVVSLFLQGPPKLLTQRTSSHGKKKKKGRGTSLQTRGDFLRQTSPPLGPTSGLRSGYVYGSIRL